MSAQIQGITCNAVVIIIEVLNRHSHRKPELRSFINNILYHCIICLHFSIALLIVGINRRHLQTIIHPATKIGGQARHKNWRASTETQRAQSFLFFFLFLPQTHADTHRHWLKTCIRHKVTKSQRFQIYFFICIFGYSRSEANLSANLCGGDPALAGLTFFHLSTLSFELLPFIFELRANIFFNL